MGELDRKSWYMVATDSQTLLKDLARQSTGVDPRDAGLETWTLLMNMIGRQETAEEYSGDFDDLMLKEWARQHLLSHSGSTNVVADTAASVAESISPSGIGRVITTKVVEPIDDAIERAAKVSRSQEVTEGSIVRGSSAERSPFLLSNQELHKSLILIINDDPNISVGVILNRPSTKAIDIEIKDQKTLKSRKVQLPLRFGGQFAVKGTEPLLWLHSSEQCREAELGTPLGTHKNGIWKCSIEDVTQAISKGLAKPDEFMVITGVSVWTKNEEGFLSGMQGEVQAGRFEVVPDSKVERIWNTLIQQEVLTAPSMVQSLAVSDEAWKCGGLNGETKPRKDNPSEFNGRLEEVDEEGYTLVFKSDTKVSKLGDDALKSWVATFLLNAPSLGA